MSRQLIDELEMSELQSHVIGLECDQAADFNFILGDLNYRLKTYFSELNNSNVHDVAIQRIEELD